MDKLDQVAADYVGLSIVELLYDEKQYKSRPFYQIFYTHPALFMVQFLWQKRCWLRISRLQTFCLARRRDAGRY
jgi:hypothetical protein